MFVVVMSAPGLEVGAVDLRHDLRLREVQQVGVALDVAGVVGEAVAAELLLGETPALQQDAPGAVEHEDPLARGAARGVRAVSIGFAWLWPLRPA